MRRTTSSGKGKVAGAALAVSGLLAAGAVVVHRAAPAQAQGLEAFDGCSAIAARATAARVASDRAEAEASRAVPLTAGREDVASAADQATEAAASPAMASDGTNTQVAGIDELDVVEVLTDGRIVVVQPTTADGAGGLLLVDASGHQVLDRTPVPPGAQITADDQGTVWAVATGPGADDIEQITTLQRVRLEGDAFVDAQHWTVAGHLVDLRRVGSDVHLVVSDDPMWRVEPMAAPGGAIDLALPSGATMAIPPAPPATPPATPADPLAPLAAPPQRTEVGKVDPALLPFAGTSPVPCAEVLHPGQDGYRAAATLVATFHADGDLEPAAAVEVVGAGEGVLVSPDALYLTTTADDSDGTRTGIHRFTRTGLDHTGSGVVEGRLLNQFALDEHAGHLRAAVIVDPEPVELSNDGPIPEMSIMPVEPGTGRGSRGATGPPRNEVQVFDLDGDLDLVGRSARFGKPGETLHGIRFAGEVAYAVTFRTTDPFYVIDLADPTAPQVQGELEIPGFSGYLHPVSATHVVGFGPGPDGRATARLFGVADPWAPADLDVAAIADHSPVVADHHALRTWGDAMVVPGVTWPEVRCAPSPRRAMPEPAPDGSGEVAPSSSSSVSSSSSSMAARCAADPEPTGLVVSITVVGDRLVIDATAIDVAWPDRVLPLDGGALVVGDAQVVRVDAAGARVAELA